MRRLILFSLILIVAFALPASAQLKAVVKEFTGKVEVKESGKDWAPAVAGMTLSQGTMLSTGFGSRMVIEIGLSRITVSPLTRMLVEDVVKKETTNSASFALKVGKVNAQVKSAAGERSEFTLKGPASTAAVRGTEFSYDGYTLQVIEGIVQFFNLLSQARSVAAGESSGTSGYTVPTGGESGNLGNSLVLGASGGGLGGGQGGGGGNSFIPPVLTGTIAVTVQ